jgi:phospholipid-translocating ATPase
LTLRGSFKNPNLTQARSKSFGIPTFITTFFLQRTLAQEAEDAEQDRSETRKRFWGRRSVKKPVPASPILGDDVKLAPVASATNYGRQEGDDYADERDAGPLRDMAHEVVLARLVPHPFTHYDRPTWVKESWEDLKVGDFVRLRGDESVPAGG